MFYVNNNKDIDDLFRDAAEHYPLKTRAVADWGKMAAELQQENSSALSAPATLKKERKRRFFLWWVLLLPLGWMGHESWQSMHQAPSSKPPTELRAGKLNRTLLSAPATHLVAPALQRPENSSQISFLSDKKKNVRTTGRENTLGTSLSTGVTNSRVPVGTVYLPARGLKPGSEKEPGRTDQQVNRLRSWVMNTHWSGLAERSMEEKEQWLASSKWKAPDSLRAFPPHGIQSTGPNAENKVQAKPTVHIQQLSHFYATLMIGMDASTIKFQAVKAVGNSLGGLLGYHINRARLDLETGLFWDTKKYYTDGTYIDNSKFGYPSGINIAYVNGTCNMFEIPVNLRYHFLNGGAHSFFVAGGLSSYLMQKEAYTFAYQTGGWWGLGNSSFYHSTQNWLSIVNLSLGYEHSLGKMGDIRIEPYAKLPVTGIGKGGLSILSGGLNLGISRRF